jgi:hypothetical protein
MSSSSHQDNRTMEEKLRDITESQLIFDKLLIKKKELKTDNKVKEEKKD